VIKPTTREKYACYPSAHIYPVLGPLRIADIFPEHLREWITWMQREGWSARAIQYCKSSILNSIFTTALNDQVTQLEGVRFSHRWGRAIDTRARFCAFYGTAFAGRPRQPAPHLRHPP
jgi:hypothetical protein